MRSSAGVLLYAASLLACSKAEPPVGESQLALARQVGIPDSAFRAIHRIARADLTPLQPLDSAGNVLPPRGIAFGIETGKVAAVLVNLRETLGPGYLVFESDRGYTYHPDSIGIVRSRDLTDMLRVMSTSGVNYDVYTDSIIQVVTRWRDSLGFQLEAAGGDWLEGSFPGRGPNYDSLATAVFALCPDVVEQGTNTVEALAAEMRRTGKLYCWWD